VTAQSIKGFEYKAGMLVKDNTTGLLWRVPEDFGYQASYYQTVQADDPATGGILLSMLGNCVTVEAPWVKGNLWHVQIHHGKQNIRMAGASLGEACIKIANEIGQWPNG
jgi:hypothetical protein